MDDFLSEDWIKELENEPVPERDASCNLEEGCENCGS